MIDYQWVNRPIFGSPGTCQTEGGLGLLDPGIDGAHIAREIAETKR